MICSKKDELEKMGGTKVVNKIKYLETTIDNKRNCLKKTQKNNIM